MAVFYSDPDNDGEGPPHGCDRRELDGLFARDVRLLEEHVERATFPGRQGRGLIRLLARV